MGASKEKDNDFENWQSIKRDKEGRVTLFSTIFAKIL
jgi:hypothetical protein